MEGFGEVSKRVSAHTRIDPTQCSHWNIEVEPVRLIRAAVLADNNKPAHNLLAARQLHGASQLPMPRNRFPRARKQLQWLLKNPFYYGSFRWKGRTWAGSHRALVSRELWDAVQAAFSAHEKPVYRKHDFAYKGLLICGSCGRHLTAEIKKQPYVYYHCAGEEACRKTYIREEQFDEQVRALLASIAIPNEAKAWLLQGIAKSREEQRAYHQTVVKEIRTEVKEQELLMDRLYDDRLQRLIAEDFFRQRWDQLEEKRSQLSRDLARHQHAEGAYMELGSKLIELIAQAPQIFERADPEQRRELVGLLTSNRVLKGRTLEFELRKPFDALVSAANDENGWGVRIRTLGSPGPQDGAGQAGVTVFDAQRQRRHLPPAGADVEEIETFEDRDAGAKQSMVRGRSLDAVALDREIIDPDQLDLALHHPISAVGGQVHEVGPKGTRRVPPARIAGAQQNPTGAARNARPAQIGGADAALRAPQVADPCGADEALEVHLVDPLPALDEVARSVDMGARVRAKAELAEVDVILPQRHRGPDPDRRITPIDRHGAADRDGDVDELHVISG
jgi:hypothetical protein